MARSNISVIERLLDKIVLGVCALLMLGAIGMFVVGSPFKSASGLGPDEVSEETAKQAEAALRAVQSKKPDPSKGDIIPDLDRTFGSGPDAGLIPQAAIAARIDGLNGWQPPLIDVERTSEEDKHELAKLIAPDAPVVVRTGESNLKLVAPQSFDELLKEKKGEEMPPATYTWATAVSRIDLLEQGRVFRAARYSPDRIELTIVGVQLQRRRSDDDNAPWEDVTPYRPYKAIEFPALRTTSDGRLTSDTMLKIDELRNELRHPDVQDIIARSQVPATAVVEGGTPITYPDVPFLELDPVLDAQYGGAEDSTGGAGVTLGTGGRKPPKEPVPVRRFNQWLKGAEAAMRSSGSVEERLDEAAILLEACLGEEGIDPQMRARATTKLNELKARRAKAKLPPLKEVVRRPEKLMPLAATDLSVPVGYGYVYRMRYEALNPMAGLVGELLNPADAARLTVFSDWSSPSQPVEVKTDTYFFVTAISRERQNATVRVFKFRDRKWDEDRVTVSIGDPIGEKKRGGSKRNTDFSTGAFVVDLRFVGDGEDGARLICVDSRDGRLYSRTVEGDKNHPKYIELTSRKVAGRG